MLGILEGIVMTFNKKSNLFLAFSLIIAIFVFLKNAWVSDDSYILFRSIEQLFEGNGPIWNPHERVQVFTSPLWFWLLSFVRIFSSDVYLNAIMMSLFVWILTVFILNKLFINKTILLVSIFLFTASTAFFDYTSSGLENVLAYYFIALYLLNYIRLFSLGAESMKKRIKIVFLLFGVIICVRHDLAVLLLPSTIYVMRTRLQSFPPKKWIIIVLAALSPFVLWSLFSLLYYGFPFPNTAYAKLNTGIDKIEIFKQGAKYFFSSLRFDTITLVVIGISLILSFTNSTGSHLKYLGYGIIFNLLYIAYVGGDFMQGRFLSYAYMVSVILLLLLLDKNPRFKVKPAVWLAIVLYLLLYPHTPFNSLLNYRNPQIVMGIADERGFYFRNTSLFRYFVTHRKSEVFPSHPWSFEGLQFKKHSDIIRVFQAIGFYGYWSGTNKIIVDPYALSNPLLARMPVRKQWRVGHYPRDIPGGYIESIINNNEVIADKQINR